MDKDIRNLSIKFELSERSQWHCYLFGGLPGDGLVWNPEKGKEPNWFWRWMQWLFFGNRWVKAPNHRHSPDGGQQSG
jgi:hypothetical protein